MTSSNSSVGEKQDELIKLLEFARSVANCLRPRDYDLIAWKKIFIEAEKLTDGIVKTAATSANSHKKRKRGSNRSAAAVSRV